MISDDLLDTCGYCGDTGPDYHDLNELTHDVLPEAQRFRCCECYSAICDPCPCGMEDDDDAR